VILSFLIMALCLVIGIKLTFFLFRVMGRILAILLSLIGYVILGALAVPLLGVAITFLPVLAVVAVIGIIVALLR